MPTGVLYIGWIRVYVWIRAGGPALGLACEAARDTWPSHPHHLAGLQLQLTTRATWPPCDLGRPGLPVPSPMPSAKGTLSSGRTAS